MTADFLLDRHMRLRDNYGALLLFTRGFAYREQDFWASVVPQAFPAGDDALGWCRDKSLGKEDCYAVFLTHDLTVEERVQFQK